MRARVYKVQTGKPPLTWRSEHDEKPEKERCVRRDGTEDTAKDKEHTDTTVGRDVDYEAGTDVSGTVLSNPGTLLTPFRGPQHRIESTLSIGTPSELTQVHPERVDKGRVSTVVPQPGGYPRQ